MIKAPSKAELEAGAARVAAMVERPVPRAFNADSNAELNERRALHWMGRRYWVPPVPQKLGAQLYALQLDLLEIHRGRRDRGILAQADPLSLLDLEAEREALSAEQETSDRAVGLFVRLVSPHGRWHRLRWRLGLCRNPFRKATAREVADLLGFFSGAQTASRVVDPRAARQIQNRG